jgi:uncharacterized Zn finger protein (UPF0148 family)
MTKVCAVCGIELVNYDGGALVCTSCRNSMLRQAIAEAVPAELQNQRYDDQWTYPSTSTAGKSYKVSRLGDAFQCSCPVWKFRRAECNHIKDVRQTLELHNIPPPEPVVKRRRFRLER